MDQLQTWIDSIPARLERLDKDKILPIVSIAAATTLLYTTYKLYNKPTQGLREIPSPSGAYPYFGHMLAIGNKPSEKVAEWHKEAGHIFKVKMGIQTWIMIDDPILANKVFVTHGVNTSDRPNATFINYYSHHGKGLAFTPADKRWRDARAAVVSIISPKYVETNYIIPIEREAADLATRLILYSKKEKGVDPVIHLHLNSMNIIFMSSFGKRFSSVEDQEFISISATVLKSLSLAGPEHDLSNFLPILSIIEYFSGKIKIMTDYIKNERDPLYKKLIADALKQKETNLVKELAKYDFDDQERLVIMSDLINGGTDTVSVTLAWVFAIMCHYPHIQKKAAAEIDLFIQKNQRLPAFADRDSLPYVICVLKECMRFRSITPFGLPHKANKDIIVDGYLIPKGAGLFYSLESMHMNPEVYSDPETFNPERFSNNLELMDTAAKGKPENRDHFNFGFGRRICAGMYMAEAELLTSFIHVISKCTIEPIKDNNGKNVLPDIKHAVNAGATLIPAPYKLNFVERANASV